MKTADVKVTGLGLPNRMRAFVEDGTVEAGALVITRTPVIFTKKNIGDYRFERRHGAKWSVAVMT